MVSLVPRQAHQMSMEPVTHTKVKLSWRELKAVLRDNLLFEEFGHKWPPSCPKEKRVHMGVKFLLEKLEAAKLKNFVKDFAVGVKANEQTDDSDPERQEDPFFGDFD